MFDAKKPEDPALDNAIDTVYSEMAGESSDSEAYSKMTDELVKLYSLKQKPQRVSPDTVLIVIGNLAGILTIVLHERTHIVMSKAMNLLMKTR